MNQGTNYLKHLVDRLNIFCQSNNVNLIKYIFSHDYMLKVKKITKEPYYNKPGTDGVIDTIIVQRPTAKKCLS